MTTITLAEHIFFANENPPRLYLPASGVKCRFCGATPTFPAIKFKRDAHVFPEALGNGHVFSSQECDACNNGSSRLESDLSAFLTPLRFWSAIKGKNSSFKHKVGRSGEIRSNLFNDHSSPPLLNMHVADDSIHLRRTDSGISLTIRMGKYSLENVARALARLAIFAMPEHDLENSLIRNVLIPWVLRRLTFDTPRFFWFALYPRADRHISAFRVDRVSTDSGDMYQVLLMYAGAMIYMPICLYPSCVKDVAPPEYMTTSGGEPIVWTLLPTDAPTPSFQEFTLVIEALRHVAPPTTEEIRIAAYQAWQDRGAPDGRSLDDWLYAEKMKTFEQLSSVFGADWSSEGT